ncbi:MAG: S8 family serine peptidase [candidate division KSB1 bacterium]|nr:S8 family serine peptidase [candidate division KSB1 bacterium]
MSSKKLLALAAGLIFLFPLFGETAAAVEKQKYWIFFRNKGPQVLSKRAALVEEAKERLSPRALQRRAKVLPPNALVDESDFDLYQPYVSELIARGFQPVVTSRWLNAISILATPEEIAELQKLPFVESVRRVAALRLPPPSEPEPAPPRLVKTTARRFEYGGSLAQMEQIRATDLHDAGIYGTGVIVGMLDSGFRWQDHEAFRHLHSRIIGERDFVNNDGITRNQPGDPSGQDSHGTQTLSTLGGFMPGQLIGPGFGASFILAKTENIASETHAEEDFWAAAIEWMEGLGVDVTSTSLGYSTFDPGQGNYTPADMNGRTAIITRAAEIAVSKGIIVVCSAGNEGNSSWRIITAPADGPNVIAVGAVFSTGGITSFSSRGPTADGRIKPDVMAMGAGVRVVAPTSTSQYTFSNGTSFSCPLVAGVAAQILSAHPEVTPQQMMNALRTTASMANSPNNNYGYGIVNARAAITSLGPAFSNLPEVDRTSSRVFNVSIHILSRDGIVSASVRAHYANRGSAAFTAVTMTPVDSISYFAQIPRPAQPTDTLDVYFSATDLGFGEVRYPKRAPQRVFLIWNNGIAVDVEASPRTMPQSFTIEPSRPNPFGSIGTGKITRFVFDLPQSGAVQIRIYNVLGQRVRTLVDAHMPAGRYENIFWDGTDDLQRPVAGGVYFYEISTPAGIGRRKLLLIR